MTRDDGEQLLKKYVKNERMLNHCYAAEAVMRSLAARFGEDVEKWGLAGLLHDIDIEVTDADLSRHCLEAQKILTAEGIDPETVEAIVMHNEAVTGGRKRETRFQHALAAAETITGLVVATTLVYPDKKLASVKTKSVVKRMKEKAFAASVNRDIIMECEVIGIPLNEFAELSIAAMLGISGRLGL